VTEVEKNIFRPLEDSLIVCRINADQIEEEEDLLLLLPTKVRIYRRRWLLYNNNNNNNISRVEPQEQERISKGAVA
jgi:hypothetical protein